MTEEECKCIKIIGHLEAVRWHLWPRDYRPSPGVLAVDDWTTNQHIWLHYVESTDGILPDDDILRSTDTRYWSIHDVQRYFVGELHCERVLFTYQYPNIRMPTRFGSYLWKANTALKLPPALYMRELHRSLETTLKKFEAEQIQINRLILCDQLIKIDRLDCFKRQTFFRLLGNIISYQDDLELVSLENLCCTRLEGVRLIQQLACFNSHSLKYLFLWRFVLPNENPLLINYSYITGSGRHLPRPDSRRCFLRSLAELRNLRLLALEYSHIADGTGYALMALLPVLRRPHFRLQLICREDQIPGRADAALGAGGHGVPDTVWRRVSIACPDLYLLMAFFRIREYDNVRRFLSPSVPLREVHLQRGLELCRGAPDSDLTCFVRHVAYRYGDTLVTLSIHEWRGALFPLRRVVELLPALVRLLYAGLADPRDLDDTLAMVACGVARKLKQLHIQVQDEESTRAGWADALRALRDKYKDIMHLLDIQLCLQIYKN
ncbi:uncharacterized protein LOC119835846 [Zerene cesonia]|uniref:uncharacterized protein LOC119835846 n=1 Tax=Zerene cesonia TaxID=33412 RepID=UPI0018E53F87|nr:uncharacterized protein LOC119835846 [Zerene cesonia]